MFGYQPLIKRPQPSAPKAAVKRSSAQSAPIRPRANELENYGRPSINSAPYQPSAPSAEALAQASTDRNEAREALARIPWDALSPKAKEKIGQITSAPTLYRRLPMAGGRCNPELFDFFLTYPNAVVELWRSMGYEEVTMVPEGNNIYALREKNGSAGKVQVLYQDAETTLAYASGSYRGPALGRQLTGEVFLVLQTRYTEEPDLTPLVVCRMDAFVVLNNPGVDLLARTFSSAIGKIADSNFTQTLAFIDSVSQMIEENPEEFQSVAYNLPGIPPEARRLLLAKTETIARQARARRAGQRVDYQLLAKKNAPAPSIARILSRGSSNYVAKANPVPQPTSVPTPVATSRAGSSSTPSLGRTNPILDSNDFSLADDDFEASIEWDDEPEDQYVYSSKGSSAAPFVPGGSLAKVGARPSTRSEAATLLEEQESRLAPSYARSAETITTSDNGDEEFALEFDDEVEEPSVDEVEEPLALATPAAKALEESDDNSTGVVAARLAATDESGVVEDDEPIYLELPDDIGFEGNASDSDESAPAFEAATNVEADDDALIATPFLSSDGAADALAAAEEEAPQIEVEEEEEVASSAKNAPLAVVVEDDDEAEAPSESPAFEPIGKSDASKSSSDSEEESFEETDRNSGWVPVASSAPSRAVERVATRIDESETFRAPSRTGWSGAIESPKPRASVPRRFTTRRYASPESSSSAQSASDAKEVATFKSEWRDPERVRQINPSDSPTFKSPDAK